MQFTTGFCTIPGMNPVHIGTRIATLRERAGLNQSELARALGIKPQAVQKWEAGNAAPRPQKLKAIAAALSTSMRELIRGTEMEEPPDSSVPKGALGGKVSLLRGAKGGAPKSESGFLPLISWAQAVDWGPDVGNFKPEEAQDWIRCPFDHGPAAFILEVEGESNFDPTGPKSYAPGEFIAVDPSRTPANRSMVVVRMDRHEHAAFRQLLMDESGVRLLKALNPSWPNQITAMPDGASIIGVVIGKWVPE